MILFADENDESQRLDNFLNGILSDYSRSKIQSFIKDGCVFVNSSVKKSSYQIREGDKIEINLPDIRELKIEPQNIPLEIVYEDENMLVVNKPSGMLTHPTSLELENTLVNALLYKFGENLSDINGEFRRGILHRLDRNTSGLLMIAKNDEEKRSRVFGIVTMACTVLIILIGAFMLIRLFTGNPIEGIWEGEDTNLVLTIKKDIIVADYAELLGDTDAKVELSYTMDKDAKTITIKTEDEKLQEAAQALGEGIEESELKSALGMITTTFEYSMEDDRLTLTEREYGEQLVFVKK